MTDLDAELRALAERAERQRLLASQAAAEFDNVSWARHGCQAADLYRRLWRAERLIRECARLQLEAAEPDLEPAVAESLYRQAFAKREEAAALVEEA